MPALPLSFLDVPPKAGRHANHLVIQTIWSCAGTPNQQLIPLTWSSLELLGPKALLRRLLLLGLFAGLNGCFHRSALEKNTIQPHRDDVNHDQNWNKDKPLILKFIGKLLNSKDRQVSGDQSEDKSANAGGIQSRLMI